MDCQCQLKTDKILKPKHSDCHFADDVCKIIFSDKNCILMETSLIYYMMPNYQYAITVSDNGLALDGQQPIIESIMS